MNSKERYLNLLAGEPVDFIPRIPILMRFAAEYIGSDWGQFAADHRVMTKANVVCNEYFGIDQMNTMSDPFRETEGFGAKVSYSPDHGVRIDRPPLADGVDLSLLKKPDPETSTRMRDRMDALRFYLAHYRDTHSIMGWVEGPAAEAADIRGVEDFFIGLLTEPEDIAALMDVALDNAITYALAQIALGVDTIGIGDAVASQVSPELYEEFILPRERKLVDAIKGAGAIARMHICGNITHLLPGLATLGLDIVDVDYLVDMKTARKVLGDRVVLGGNLDPVADVLQSNPAAIREKLKIARDEAGPRFIVNAGCEIPSPTPPENLKALCEPLTWDD
ncbi:MAG: uroporphyrinogen decarboxylase family protein [Actinomycetia bacterium]|nr:uroporphyrinogen decarboxylase family protein [Actinomycetes bacterium]